jgi:hypothetical protein
VDAVVIALAKVKMRFTKERVAQLRGDIRTGFDAIDRGEYDDYDQHTTKQLAEDIKTRGRQRLAEASKKTGAR